VGRKLFGNKKEKQDMATLNDPKINDAYADVRNDATDTNWLIVTYESDTSNNVVLYKTGSDGLEGCKSALSEINAGWGYIRFQVGNDELSKRSKFVFFTWSGPGIKVLRKARLSVHIIDVKKVIRDFAVELNAESLDELKEDQIILLVKKAMGANYDRQASSY